MNIRSGFLPNNDSYRFYTLAGSCLFVCVTCHNISFLQNCFFVRFPHAPHHGTQDKPSNTLGNFKCLLTEWVCLFGFTLSGVGVCVFRTEAWD